MRTQKTLILLFLIIYGIAFFATPFEPYRTSDGITNSAPPRGFFFHYLLIPEDYFAAWFASDAEVIESNDTSFFAGRVTIFFTAIFGLFAACGIGAFTLRVFFLAFFISLSRAEQIFFAVTLGLHIGATAIFLLGIGGQLFFSPTIFFTLLGISGNVAWWQLLQKSSDKNKCAASNEILENAKKHTDYFHVFCFVSAIPFAAMLILGSMIPSTDYDVLAYHLAAPREFVLAGRIEFLPHNVYANMPLAAEMFAVWGMIICGDFFLGGMVGKTLIACTTLITSLGLYAFGKRFFSPRVGLVAMLLYLSTPWMIYVSSVGLIDTVVGLYALSAIYLLVLLTTRESNCEEKKNFVQKIILLAIFAGAAATCKYPALVFIALPIWFCVFVFSLRIKPNSRGARRVFFHTAFLHAVIFGVVLFFSCGAWYLKNFYFTGNPVYPLAFSIFGDTSGSWSDAVNARWVRVHSPPNFSLITFFHDSLCVFLTSAWNSPLMMPLAILAALLCGSVPPCEKKRCGETQRKVMLTLFISIVFFLTTWWLFTHRLDRFWLPIFPAITMCAAIGFNLLYSWGMKKFLASALVINIVFCFLVSGAAAAGKNSMFFTPLEAQRKSLRIMSSSSLFFNANPPRGKILLVGDAQAFLYDAPTIQYATCFNEKPLREIFCTQHNMTDSAQILAQLQQREISHTVFNWNEISRFRSAGNYGFADCITPELVTQLVRDGVLEKEIAFDAFLETLQKSAPPTKSLSQGVQIFRVCK